MRIQEITRQNYPQGMVKIIDGPTLKDAFIEASDVLRGNQLRGAVYIPTHPQQDETQKVMALLNSQLAKKNTTPKVYPRTYHQGEEDTCKPIIHLDGIFNDTDGNTFSSPRNNSFCLHYKQGPGSILFEAIFDEDDFHNSGLLREEACMRLTNGWQVPAGAALFMREGGEIKEQILHVAPVRNGVLRVLDVYHWKMSS